MRTKSVKNYRLHAGDIAIDRISKIVSINDARILMVKQKSKAIFILSDDSDMSNLKGFIYKVSSSKDTFDKLCKESDKLSNHNKPNIIIGEYENSLCIGVQYE